MSNPLVLWPRLLPDGLFSIDYGWRYERCFGDGDYTGYGDGGYDEHTGFYNKGDHDDA